MKITDGNVIRFHLQILYGITVKSLEKKRDRLYVSGAKVFGVPLESVTRRYVPEFGLVPCFLVDACLYLLERAGTVGLFRKPGSLLRIKVLRAKLNRGDECFSTALPYDVATLIKQFCRELPEPLFPSEVHEALLKAQALSKDQDRVSALQLLSCLLPAKNCSSLHYLFDFLFKVSQRRAENLMTSSNLAIVFAPCLLPPPNKTEMSEGRLELRVLVLRTFIENPHLFGVIPKSVMDSVSFLTNYSFPTHAHSKKSSNRKRHSFKVGRSVKTLSWIQGRSKVTAAMSQESTSDKPSLRRSLGLDNFPNIRLFRTYMPCADEEVSPAEDLLEGSSSTGKDACKTPQQKPKRDLRLLRFARGGDASGSPVLTAVGKLHFTPWRRRSSL